MLAMKFMVTHINLNEEKIFSQNYEAFKIMKKLVGSTMSPLYLKKLCE